MQRFRPPIKLHGRIVSVGDAGPVTTHDGDSFATTWVLLSSGQRLRVVLDQFGDIRKVIADSEIVQPEEPAASAAPAASEAS
ncbi:MAG: hypothetical protein NXI14_05945 [bacterium]|nr:hypothetical protein [bacterium]